MSSTGHHEPIDTIPSFHDGHLTSIAVERGAATLGLARSNGEAFELKLEGVEALQADDFRLGNIVFGLEVVRGKPPACFGLKERLERLFPSPHAAAAATYHARHAEFLAGVLARIEDGSATMVVISASYGCDLVAICGDIKLKMLGSADRCSA